MAEMTEREKMIAGSSYDPEDPELKRERDHCKMLCQRYNASLVFDQDAMVKSLRDLLGDFGEHCCILSPFWCDYGYNIYIGKNFFSNYNCVMLDPAPISFGDNVLVGPNCGFYTAGHPIDPVQRNTLIEYAWPIVVGDNVWIGGGVHVMPGVTIGSNSIIGGGSVVTKSIPPGVIAVGNPCRVVRKITSADAARDYTWRR